MRQKSLKGFSSINLLINLLTVAAIILVVVAIGGRIILGSKQADFRESFGVEISKREISDEERQIIKPLVTKRLQELMSNLQMVQNLKAGLLALPEAATPKEATQRINELKKIETKITSAYDKYDKAVGSANYFGFKP